MLSEEQKYEHTCDRVQNVIGECVWKIRDMIEQSGLDINTSDLGHYFEALKSHIEIMMESS